jgi:hypothetical protein
LGALCAASSAFRISWLPASLFAGLKAICIYVLISSDSGVRFRGCRVFCPGMFS